MADNADITYSENGTPYYNSFAVPVFKLVRQLLRDPFHWRRQFTPCPPLTLRLKNRHYFETHESILMFGRNVTEEASDIKDDVFSLIT